VYRPYSEEILPENESDQDILHCLTIVMEECWSEHEQMRPTFDVCLEAMYKLAGDKYVP